MKFRKKKIIPIIIATTIFGTTTGTVVYKYFDSKKITLITKEDTSLDDLSKKLNIDINNLKRWNKDLVDSKNISKGEEVEVKVDLDNADNYQTYTIQIGDTTKSVAQKFGIAEDELKNMDKALKSNKTIAENYGKEVEIFSLNSTSKHKINYIINSGDTLYSISRYLGVSISDIKEQNNMASDTIIAGHVLSITADLTDEKYEEIVNRNQKIAYKLYLELTQGDNVVEVGDEADEKKQNKVEQKSNQLFGIDVSEYQKNIDWKKVSKDNISYAIIKMFDAYNMTYERNPDTLELEGSLSKLDKYFLKNVQGCEKNNIPYGIYIYSRAVTEEQAKIEAEKFLKFAKQYNIKPTWPIYYDIEPLESQPLYDENGNSVNAANFFKDHPKQVLKNFKAWANILEENGYYCGIYCNESGLQIIDPSGEKLKDYAVWLAKFKYSVSSGIVNNSEMSKVNYEGNYGIYQFSESGTCDGIDGYVDKSIASVNYKKIIEKGNFNQEITQEETSKTKVLR